MSTVKTTNFQVGTSGTASQNFTITALSDGTFKISRGNAGATTGDLLTIDASNNISINATSKLGNVQVGTSATNSQNFSLLAPANGAFILSRGNLGFTTGDLLTIDASNNISINAVTKLANVQIGTSATNTQNFSLIAPADGTFRLARGNLGFTTGNIISINSVSGIVIGPQSEIVVSTDTVILGNSIFAVGGTTGGNNGVVMSNTIIYINRQHVANNLIEGRDTNLSRFMTRDLGAVYVDKGTQSTNTDFDYTGGSLQRLQVGGALTISFSNFPPSGNMGVIQIELVNGGSAVVTFPTINWIKKDGTFTTSITTYLSDFGRAALQTSGTDFFVVWTRDAGTTLYGKLL